MPYQRPGATLTATLIESWLNSLELIALYGQGRGVLTGLALSDGGGLDVDVSPGTLLGLQAVEFGDTLTTTLSPSSTLYLWLDESGTFVTTATLSDPGGTYVCLGKVVTGGSTITSIDSTGRMSIWRQTTLWTFKLGEDLIHADTQNNRVGIRQATPLYPFDVSVGDDTGLARFDDMLLKQIGSAPATVASHFQVYCRSGNLYCKTPGGAEVLIVDGAAGSLAAPSAFDWKASARAVATSNINISSPGSTIDGVSLSSGDRVLLTAQSTASQNGLWTWNGAAVAMTRPSDFDASSEVTAGVIVPVTEGSTYADTIWMLTTNDPITIDSTSLAFQLTGSNFTALAGNGLSVSGAGLAVNVDGSTLEINSDSLRVKDVGITEGHLGFSDVTTANRDASKHGLAKKLSGNAFEVEGGDGNWKPSCQMFGCTRAASTNGSLTAGATRYMNPNNGCLMELTQSDAEIKIPRAGRLLNLRINIAAVPASGTCTFKVMINGSVTSTPNISLTSGSSTGWNEDVSTVIAVAAGDLITIECIGASSGTVTVRGVSLEIDWS